MLRSLRPTVLLVAAALVTACGGDDDPERGAAATDTPAVEAERKAPDGPVANVDLAEAQGLLESGRIALVREALEQEAPISEEVEPSPTIARRLEEQSGKEFSLLVFASPDEARRAWSSVMRTDAVREDGGAAIRAVNLIAVFPEPAEDGVYARIKDRLRALATACRGGDAGAATAELRRACFRTEGGGVPPEGDGTGSDEAAPTGATVDVGGIAYDVTTARQLNPRIVPDREIVGDVEAGEGSVLFAVMLRACNERGAPARTAERLRLIDAFGTAVEPVDLPAGNPFAYESERLERGDCVPPTGSAADRTTDGAAVVFELPLEVLRDRPLALQITGPSGDDRARVLLDV